MSEVTVRQCPDGSWSKERVTRCVLTEGHRGSHKYVTRSLGEHVSGAPWPNSTTKPEEPLAPEATQK